MKSQEDFENPEGYKYYLRTCFAAMAMQGLLGDPTLTLGKREIGALAVDCADELLKALES